MTESSVCAISLPNATLRGNWLYWAVNVRRIFYGVPKANQDFICLLWGKAEVRVAFNDRAERYHSCNLVTEHDVTERDKPRQCLFAFKSGPPEQTKIYLFAMGRSGGTSCFNDDRSVIGLRNLVTERDVIGQYDLIVERDVTERDATGELALLGGECA